MGHQVPRTVVGLLAGLSVLQLASGRCGGGQWGPGPRQRLLSDELREACTNDAQRLVFCSTYSSPYTLLTANQRATCCASLQQFNLNGCFCGWGAAADVSPRLQSILVDLAAVVEECADVRVPCRAEEEYFREAAQRAATAGRGDPQGRLPLPQGLSSGQEGLQGHIFEGTLFRGPYFRQRRAADDEVQLLRPRAVRAPAADIAPVLDDVQQEWDGSDAASLAVPVLAGEASGYEERERDEHVLMDMSMEEMLGDLGDSGKVVHQAISAILLPLMDVKVLKKLLGLLSESISTDDDSAFGDADGQMEKSRQLDIEVEIEHSGPDLKELSSGLKRMASWMLAVSKGDSLQDLVVDPMDRVDNLSLLVGRLMDVLNEFLQFPNAQVELALDITVETEQQPVMRRGKMQAQEPLLEDLSEVQDMPERELDMEDMQGEGIMGQNQESHSNVLLNRMVEEEANARLSHAHGGCWMTALVLSMEAHPGLVMGVTAFPIIFTFVGLFLLLVHLKMELRRERAAQMQNVYPVVLASDDCYLSPDLTTPLLDTQGSLLNGYPTGKQ